MPAKKPKGKLVKVARYRVKFNDVFDMKAFYESLHEWCKEYDWIDEEDGFDHYETLYLDKTDMNGMKEMWIKWRPSKIPTANSYYKYHLDFDYHVVGMSKKEIIHQGHKKKIDKGEVEIYITAQMELDYTGTWSSHPILKYFNKLFPERIFRKELFEQHKKELYREAYALQRFIKEWLKLKRYLPYEEAKSFFPSEAIPSHLKNE
ncbi:hypothetical protein HOC13_04080 [Candidatus Woesearchaeota archaeon]|jgi:hypothetical protein|nr:hypothetical protein [Candidatus Woesearchaeota archaeon]